MLLPNLSIGHSEQREESRLSMGLRSSTSFRMTEAAGFPVPLRMVKKPKGTFKPMDLNQAASWRKLAGRACALFCLLASLAILDGLVTKFREPVNVFHVLPGDEVDIDGPIPENIKQTEVLTYASDSKGLAITFAVIHPGYFMGGNMWRGRLSVARDVPPGKYVVTVRPRDYPAAKPGYEFRVVVYPDAMSQRVAFPSMIKRQTGRSPYLVAAAFLPLILITLGMVYLLSRRIDLLQAASGRAEIYRVARNEGQLLVSFGLGTKHGVKPGDQVTLLDPEGNYVGTVRVEESSEQDSVGYATIERDIRPGYLVSRSQ